MIYFQKFINQNFLLNLLESQKIIKSMVNFYHITALLLMCISILVSISRSIYIYNLFISTKQHSWVLFMGMLMWVVTENLSGF